MEHRWSPRFPVSGSVIVDGAALGSYIGNVHDISLGGMAIKFPADPFPVDTMVTLSFSLCRGKETRHFRTEAVVVRNLESGVGLMFVDDSPQHVEPLRDLLPPGHSVHSPRHGDSPDTSEQPADPVIIAGDRVDRQRLLG
jgi:hypothetical protein